MVRLASYYVAAQERYYKACERALESTTEALAHIRKCTTCRVLGTHNCRTFEDLDRRVKADNKSVEREAKCLEFEDSDYKKLYNFTKHIAEDNKSRYQEYAEKTLSEIKEEPYGKRIGRKGPQHKVEK